MLGIMTMKNFSDHIFAIFGEFLTNAKKIPYYSIKHIVILFWMNFEVKYFQLLSQKSFHFVLNLVLVRIRIRSCSVQNFEKYISIVLYSVPHSKSSATFGKFRNHGTIEYTRTIGCWLLRDVCCDGWLIIPKWRGTTTWWLCGSVFGCLMVVQWGGS
jgi:hypothetical protein